MSPLIPFLALLTASPAVPAHAGAPSAVQVEAMSEDTVRGTVTVKLAPNWLKEYGVDAAHYIPALRSTLQAWWVNVQFTIELGDDVADQIVVVESEIGDATNQEILEAVTDHFFDEYDPDA